MRQVTNLKRFWHLPKQRIGKYLAALLASLFLCLSMVAPAYAVGSFDITLHPNTSGRGSMTIDWSSYPYADKCFKVYRSSNGQTFEMAPVDYTKITNVRCLQIYPLDAAAGQLKSWVENSGYGHGIIHVDQVRLDQFNANPLGYLKDGAGNWKYDVIFFGTYDSNGGADCDLSSYSRNIVEQYIQSGRGAIFGHDTIASETVGFHPNFKTLAPYVGIGFINYNYMDITNHVIIAETGLFTTYPNYVGTKGTVLTIPPAHSLGQIVTTGTMWLRFESLGSHNDAGQSAPSFLTTHGNCAMIQTGHSSGESSEDEKKIISNLIFYCDQLLFGNASNTDAMAVDNAAPNRPSISFSGNTVRASATDNGSTYYYYVESYGKNNTSPSGILAKSPTKNYAVTTGVAQYRYIYDDNPNTQVSTVSGTATTGSIPLNTSRRYLHVAAIDGAGNLGSTKTVLTGATIQKIDTEFNSAAAQGDGTLAGAVFTAYTGNTSVTATTDANGYTVLHGLDPNTTYTIRETSAPAGYTTDTSWGGTMRPASQDGTGQINLNTVFGRAPKDTIIRGTLSGSKFDTEFNAAKPQGGATLAGCEITVTNKSAHTIIWNGHTYAPNAVVTTAKTDTNGRWSVASLPYGTYAIAETRAPDGYQQYNGWDTTVYIRSSAGVSAQAIKDIIYRADIMGYVIDKDFTVQQGDGKFSGAKLTITNANRNPVIWQGRTYAPGAVLTDNITTNADGLWTCPGIPYGEYTITETVPPIGYTFGKTRQISVSIYGNDLMRVDDIPNVLRTGSLSGNKIDSQNRSVQGDASLAGCVVQVVNKSDAPILYKDDRYQINEVVDTAITDRNGHWNIDNLPYGTYTVTEKSPSDGYELNTNWSSTVQVHSTDQTKAFSTTDLPENIILASISGKKIDSESKSAQGSGSLGGAVLSVTNASNKNIVYNDQKVAPGQQVTTMTTRSDGSYSVEGLPYGTYDIKEIQPPSGYSLNSVWTGHVIAHDYQAIAPDLDEVIVKGAVSGTKADADGIASQGDATLEGAVLEITNAMSTVIRYNRKTVQPNAVVATVKTDSQGSWTIAGLPYGTYRVREIAAPKGYELNSSWSALITMSGDTTTFNAGVVADKVKRGSVEGYKIDSGTHQDAAQGTGSLAGATIAIRNLSAHAVSVNGHTYGKGETVATTTTDANGHWRVDNLPYGTYDAHETAASSCYAVNTKWSSTFRINPDAKAVIRVGDLPETVLRGSVAGTKTDADTTSEQGDATLAGAVFNIENANDSFVVYDELAYKKGDVVTTAVTDENGNWQVSGLAYGTYRVYEAQAPYGYLLNKTWSKTITVGKNGINVGTIPDTIARGGIHIKKVDDRQWYNPGAAEGIGNATLAGAKFRIYNVSKKAVLVNGKTINTVGPITLKNNLSQAWLSSINNAPTIDVNAEHVADLTTDKNGECNISGLPCGTYLVREIEVPEGYSMNQDWRRGRIVTITSDGQIVDLTRHA